MLEPAAMLTTSAASAGTDHRRYCVRGHRVLESTTKLEPAVADAATGHGVCWNRHETCYDGDGDGFCCNRRWQMLEPAGDLLRWRRFLLQPAMKFFGTGGGRCWSWQETCYDGDGDGFCGRHRMLEPAAGAFHRTTEPGVVLQRRCGGAANGSAPCSDDAASTSGGATSMGGAVVRRRQPNFSAEEGEPWPRGGEQ